MYITILMNETTLKSGGGLREGKEINIPLLKGKPMFKPGGGLKKGGGIKKYENYDWEEDDFDMFFESLTIPLTEQEKKERAIAVKNMQEKAIRLGNEAEAKAKAKAKANKNKTVKTEDAKVAIVQTEGGGEIVVDENKDEVDPLVGYKPVQTPTFNGDPTNPTRKAWIVEARKIVAFHKIEDKNSGVGISNMLKPKLEVTIKYYKKIIKNHNTAEKQKHALV
jgi:hypothetical protein